MGLKTFGWLKRPDQGKGGKAKLIGHMYFGPTHVRIMMFDNRYKNNQGDGNGMDYILMGDDGRPSENRSQGGGDFDRPAGGQDSGGSGFESGGGPQTDNWQ